MLTIKIKFGILFDILIAVSFFIHAFYPDTSPEWLWGILTIIGSILIVIVFLVYAYAFYVVFFNKKLKMKIDSTESVLKKRKFSNCLYLILRDGCLLYCLFILQSWFVFTCLLFSAIFILSIALKRKDFQVMYMKKLLKNEVDEDNSTTT